MKSVKYIPLLLAMILTSCNNYDIQPEQAEGFIKFYSSTLTEEAYDVKATSDGGYVAIGTTVDEPTGFRNLYLVKTDQYGNEELWSPAIIGGEYDDVGTSIQVESDGYVILGYSKQTDSTEYDMYLVKTDLQGNVLWEQWAGDASDERGTNLQLTASGEYLAAGIRYNPLNGNYSYKIKRFNANGETRDGTINLAPGRILLNAYIIETQGYFMICGTEQVNGKEQIEIIRVNPLSHRSEGAQTFSSAGGLIGNCIQELGDGNLVFCGSVSSPQTGLSDVYLNKISLDLGIIPGWESPRIIAMQGDLSGLTGKSIRIVNDNSYAIIGTRTVTGNEDILLLHTDAEGTEVSRRIFGDDGFQQGMSLEITGSDGGLILLGNNGSEDNSMMALVKTDAAGKL